MIPRGRPGVEPLQAPNDFFEKQLAASFPFVQISVRNDVVHGKNALWHAIGIDGGQATYLFFRHGFEGLVSLIVGPARKDFGYGDLGPQKFDSGADVGVGFTANRRKASLHHEPSWMFPFWPGRFYITPMHFPALRDPRW